MAKIEGLTRPKPKPGKRLRSGTGEDLKKNWETCRPEFWKWTPTASYRFKAAELRDMEKLLTEDDINAIREGKENSILPRVIALELRIPWHLVALVLKKQRSNYFDNLRKSRERTSLEGRVERLLRAGVTELEDRFAQKKTRMAMTIVDIAQVSKTLMGLKQDLEESPDEAQPMRVFMNMPRPKDPGDE